SVRESSSRRRRQHPAITTTATTTSKPSRSTPRRRRRQQRPPTPTPASDDEAQETRPTIGRDAAAYMRQADAGIGARRVLEFARGDAALRESAAALSGGTAESWMSGSGGGGDEEGLGLLRQQLSAVQRIRIEHERKDATIAALRLEASADTARRWTREEEAWRKQLRDMQEQCRAERDRAEELAALEPALAKARSEAVAAAAAAARDEAGRAEAEFRAGTITERLNAEMEREWAKSRGLEDKLRVLEEELAGANRLIPEVKSLQEANETLRAELAVASERRSEVEVELAQQLKVYRPLVERADSIDRRRVAAEEGLRAATAELSRERDALAAAKDGAAELRLALERRGLRLAEAEAEVSRAAAEAAADRASAELADIRGFLVELSALLARSNAETASDGEASPGWSTNGSSTIPPSASDAPGAGAGAGGCAKVVAAISAGVKGLLAERTVAASALRELDNRFSQGKREAEEASADARDRDTAHREQLVELRSWCESEVEAQRRAKRAAQTAADCALRDLSTARRLISDFEKEKARISGNAVALNARLSTVTEEASAAKTGLRLLTRACWPLLERCRLLAEHKRLLAKWHGSSAAAAADAAAAAAARRGGAAVLGAVARRPRAGGRGGGVGGDAASAEAAAAAAAPGSQQPTTVLIVDGLRSLVDALSQDGDEEEGQAGRGLGSENGGGDPPAPASRAHGTPRRPGSSEGGGGCGEVGDTAGNVHNHQHHDKRQQRRPLVSLRATCIAAVAVQRLVRLAACRASRREAARAASAAATADSSQPDPPPPPTAAGGRPSPSRHGDAGIGEAIIPLGPRGSGGSSGGGGGVPMLLDTQVVSPGSMSLALMSLLGDHSKDGTGDPSQAGGVACRSDGGGGGGGGGGGSGDGERCMGLLGALVVVDAGNVSSAGSGGSGGAASTAATGEWFGRGGEGPAVVTGAARDAAGRTSLLEVLAGGQVGHWRRVEKRGLVPWGGSGGGSGSDPRLLGGASRVVAGRCARHHGQDVWKAWQERAAAEEACSLLGATRRGTAALARLAGEAERRLLESEAGRLQAKAEVEALEASKQSLRVTLEKKSELVSFLEERVQMMEGEASGTVPAAALAGTEKALTESLAEVETLRVRSASLYAELAEASAQRKREARQARKGAQVANQEKVVGRVEGFVFVYSYGDDH
ncbi:unnamed protein product, partial [Ectocarpus sp. 6 AP-2014]